MFLFMLFFFANLIVLVFHDVLSLMCYGASSAFPPFFCVMFDARSCLGVMIDEEGIEGFSVCNLTLASALVFFFFLLILLFKLFLNFYSIPYIEAIKFDHCGSLKNC
ncbi:hypothetical protein AAZX31_20G154300 [Glycine max]|nr:hypothetical protein GLYMA_20G167151v4 [Glycine max]